MFLVWKRDSKKSISVKVNKLKPKTPVWFLYLLSLYVLDSGKHWSFSDTLPISEIPPFLPKILEPAWVCTHVYALIWYWLRNDTLLLYSSVLYICVQLNWCPCLTKSSKLKFHLVFSRSSHDNHAVTLLHLPMKTMGSGWKLPEKASK